MTEQSPSTPVSQEAREAAADAAKAIAKALRSHGLNEAKVFTALVGVMSRFQARITHPEPSREQIEDETIERAAKVADNWQSQWATDLKSELDDFHEAGSTVAAQIADDIRALKSEKRP
jgi:hypothetical protein